MLKPRRFMPFVAFALVLFVSATAFAQPSPSPSDPVSLLTIIVMASTFAVGFFGNSVATDEILGQWKLNPSLLPVFTLGGSFLAGALKVLGPAAAAGALASEGLFVNAVYSGGLALLTALGGTAAHAHLAKVSAVKLAKIKRLAAKVATAAALLLCLGAVVTTQQACSPATIPTIEAVVQVVEKDLAANVGDSQMTSDVCKALGGSATTDAVCADVPALIQDAIQLLIDGGALPPNALAVGKSYLMAHPKAVAAPAVSK